MKTVSKNSKGKVPQNLYPPTGSKIKPGINIRERKFAAGIIKGLSAAEAMRQAGYAETTATHKQAEKLEKVGVYIAKLMEQKGPTDDRLLETLKKGLRATKKIPCNTTIRTSGKNNDPVEEPSAREMTRHFIEVEDYAIRHKYLETGLKLRGYLSKVDHSFGPQDISQAVVRVLFVAVDDKRGLPSDDGC